MQITNLLVLGAALGAMAAPSGHGHSHQHRSVHEGRGVFYKGVHHSKVGTPATTPPAATPAAAPTSASAAPAAVSSSAPSGSAAAAPSFCGSASKKRATLADIASTGNVGINGKWGSNIQLVAHNAASECEYTTTFTNVAKDPYEIICSPKIGPEGKIDGFWFAGMTFNLAPGESKTVAFDGNSQGYCAMGKGSVPKTSWGQNAGTYFEFDFGSARNNYWSGADCSSLVPASEPGQPIFGCHACDPDDNTCSTIKPDGSGTNAFVAGTAALDGLGINKPPGNAKFTVAVGYGA